MITRPNQRPLIGVVGPCASGKSTLVSRLHLDGIEARHIAQEHSYVAEMWLKLTNPKILVFLDVSFPVTLIRRHLDFWIESDYTEQQYRLRHARQHASLYIHTDPLNPDEIYLQVTRYIEHYHQVLLSQNQ
jgi:hypothetical protein